MLVAVGFNQKGADVAVRELLAASAEARDAALAELSSLASPRGARLQ